MTTKKTLASAALAGLFAAGMMMASPVLAAEHEKSACKGASGCKGKAAAEKSECKGKASCKGEAEKAAGSHDDKASCNGKSECAGKDGHKAEEKK